MVRSKIITIIANGLRWIRQKIISPVLRHTAWILLHWAALGKGKGGPPAEWKQKALDDFTSWLDELPEAAPHDDPGMDACDLYTLLTEFSALRQEIKLQTRQQRTTLKTQAALIDSFQNSKQQLNTRIERLDQLHAVLRSSIEEKAVTPFFDIRDALVRGAAAAEASVRSRGFWRRSPKGIEDVLDGYTMALRRFDRALDRMGIAPIVSVDQPFDPACMRAVAKRSVPDRKPGAVIEEYMGGFKRGSEVLRTAEVVVNSN